VEIQVVLSLLDLMPKFDKSTQPKAAVPTAAAEGKEGKKNKSVPEATVVADLDVDICPICLGDYEGTDRMARALPCAHFYHPDCIEEWYRSGRSLDGACPGIYICI